MKLIITNYCGADIEVSNKHNRHLVKCSEQVELATHEGDNLVISTYYSSNTFSIGKLCKDEYRITVAQELQNGNHKLVDCKRGIVKNYVVGVDISKEDEIISIKPIGLCAKSNDNRKKDIMFTDKTDTISDKLTKILPSKNGSVNWYAVVAIIMVVLVVVLIISLIGLDRLKDKYVDKI